MSETPVPRFAVDEMLGKLARWLRMAGFDTLHRRPFDDRELVESAIMEKRIVLTRDTALASLEPPPEAWLIEDDIPFNQMVEVLMRTGVDPRRHAFTRCALCNTPLLEKTRDQVEGLTPPFVYATQSEFHYCPTCDKVYWPGSHRARIERVLKEMADAAFSRR